jgi:hypothetical protein
MNKDLMIKIIAYILVTIGFIIFLNIFISSMNGMTESFAKAWWGK